MKNYLLLLVLLVTSHLEARNSYPVDLTKPDRILELYQLMKDAHELFEKKQIQYWADGGTLIGILNYQGIIPWDNDLDICIMDHDTDKLLFLEPALKLLGYHLDTMRWGYKIRAPLGGALDIFPMAKKNGSYTFVDEIIGIYYTTRNGDPLYYTEEELFPLKTYQFGILKIYGAFNPYPYTNASYPGWETTARFQVDHEEGIFHPDVVELTEEDKVPAEPTGPLKDRVAQLSIL